MKKIFLFHLMLTAPVLFVIWYLVYPHYLWWMEGNTFFTTAPDSLHLQYTLPFDWAEYVGSFLLQFYTYRVCGALLQMVFALIILCAADFVIARLFRNPKMLWLAFIPVAFFVSGQLQDFELTRSLWWCAVGVLAALIVWGATALFKMRRHISISRVSIPFLSYLLPCMLLGGGVYFLLSKPENKAFEEICRLEYLADQKNWDSILSKATPEDARQSSLKLRFALLALSEKTILPEMLFRYSVAEPTCFFFERNDDPFCRDFNSLYFYHLGMDNEVIHHSFQAGLRSPCGINFRSMRIITDAYLRLGQNRLGAKNLEVMKHTTCHGKWLKSRADYMSVTGETDRTGENGNENPFFFGARPFLSDMARLVDRYPENRKAVDYMLCGLLITRDLDRFYAVFTQIYARSYLSSSSLPRHYEEALLMLARERPEILTKFSFSSARAQEVQEFGALMRGGDMNRQLLKVKYSDTFWYYYSCTGKGETLNEKDRPS